MSSKVDEEKVTFPGGATASKLNPRYAIVPTEGAERVALRFAVGADKHGTHNWKNGAAEFIVERVSHLEHHLMLLKRDGNSMDDNLGAILWAGYCLAWYESNKPGEWIRAMRLITGGENANIR